MICHETDFLPIELCYWKYCCLRADYLTYLHDSSHYKRFLILLSILGAINPGQDGNVPFLDAARGT